MKRKVMISVLAISIISVFAACGFDASDTTNSSKSSSTTTTSNSTSTAAESTADYKVLDVKTDWDTKATISFSESGMEIEGSGATDEDGVLYITEGGAYTLAGSSNACSVVIDTDENVKLILNGVDLTSVNGPVIYGAEVKNLYIELASKTENSLTDSSEYATDASTGEEIGKGVISCEDDIIILGDGTLNISSSYKHGIASDDKIYIEDGTINITSTGVDGINANDLICIDGGNISIEAESDIMGSSDMLVINGGTIIGTSKAEGLEAKESLYINGGTINISTEDDGCNAGTYLEINGGDLTISTSKGDAIDCNGNTDGCIVINGGTVYAIGSSVPEGGIDADNSNVIINGGTVIAIGDVNSPIDEASEQVVIVYGSFNADETIEIRDSDGNAVFETTPTVAGNTMIISVPGLESKQTYTIYANGNEKQTVTIDSQVIEAGGSAQGMAGMGQGGPDMNQGRPEMNGKDPMDGREMPTRKPNTDSNL
ncbi:MAG: carbohydrate-binding domain-containing protein [Pseudobutyrivibrio sp.]|nr:carbohydrate-binding domain-containing protein [Pseudobutyrivibrio sp.]